MENQNNKKFLKKSSELISFGLSFSRSQILALSLPFVSVGAPVGNAKEALGTSYAFSLLGLGSSLGLSRWLVAYIFCVYPTPEDGAAVGDRISAGAAKNVCILEK